jgi:hypothetical protein
MKIKNQQFLKRPWLFTIYAAIGVGLSIYFGGPAAQTPEVILVAVGVLAVLNVWFFVSLRQTLRAQKRNER